MLPRTPSFRLDGKRAVVTGGSRGIGLGCAVALAEEGANVTIVARSKDQVFETVNNLEEKINELEQEMREAAEILNFERAADLRDKINELRGQLDKG